MQWFVLWLLGLWCLQWMMGFCNESGTAWLELDGIWATKWVCLVWKCSAINVQCFDVFDMKGHLADKFLCHFFPKFIDQTKVYLVTGCENVFDDGS